jgi:uncharacterized protein YqeY
MQADLLVARKARDEAAVTALRAALAALANAEAPPAPVTPSSTAPPVAGLVEHERLLLCADDHTRILHEEIRVRADAAEEYTSIGQESAAARLHAEIHVLQRYAP